MSRTQITVSASSPEEAASLAASRLEISPDKVAVTHVGGDDYRAHIAAREGEIQAEISSDGMTAIIAGFNPSPEREQPFTAADVDFFLKQAGVRLEPPQKKSPRWRRR